MDWHSRRKIQNNGLLSKEPNALKRRSFVKSLWYGGASGYGNGTVVIRYNHEGIQFFKYNTAPPIEIKKNMGRSEYPHLS